MWDGDGVHDLGGLGGKSWNTAMAVNDDGDVAGFANLPGDDDGTFNPHAFVWTRDGGIVDLGVLDGDDFSEALAINNARQVVGLSCGASGCRAVLWQNGAKIDLNTLAGPGFPDVLTGAQAIDDTGHIAGRVRVTATGKTLPFVATPIN
jgi:probable HAF family extracellular repeat protein